jgi:putative PIN family toxin of toxin-antitoxin system
MKVLIDTNILISALLRDGIPESVILWILAQPEWEWIASSVILQEYNGVLRREKFGFSAEFVQRWTDLFDETIQLFEPKEALDFPRDRKDAKFLECAQSANADILITGDKDFSEAQTLIKANILKPARFVQLLMTK